MLDVAGRNEFRFLAFSKYFFTFGCWLLPEKKLAFARKITALPDSEGLQPPQTLARTPMLMLEMIV